MKKLWIVLAFSIFTSGSLQSQVYFNMLKEQNRFTAEKEFALQYKIKSVKLNKYCPQRTNGECWYTEDYSYQKTYDSIGNPLTYYLYPYPYYSYKTTYTYSGDQLVKKLFEFMNDYGWYYDVTTYKYYKDGNISEAEIHNKPSYGSETWTKKIYSYLNGRVSQVQELIKGSDSLYYPFYNIDFIYNESGTKLEEKHSDPSRNALTTYIYHSNSQGKITRIVEKEKKLTDTVLINEYCYNIAGDTTLIIMKHYDEYIKTNYFYNNLSQKTEANNDDPDDAFHFLYEYDTGGNIEKEISKSKDPYYVLYFYNDKGLVKEKRIFDNNGNHNYSEKLVYEFFE